MWETDEAIILAYYLELPRKQLVTKICSSSVGCRVHGSETVAQLFVICSSSVCRKLKTSSEEENFQLHEAQFL